MNTRKRNIAYHTAEGKMAMRINQLIKSITAFVRFHFLSYSLFSIYCLYSLFTSNFHISSFSFLSSTVLPHFSFAIIFIFNSPWVCLLFTLSSLFSHLLLCLLSRFFNPYFFVLSIIIFNS